MFPHGGHWLFGEVLLGQVTPKIEAPQSFTTHVPTKTHAHSV
jgi:hypothetical protein